MITDANVLLDVRLRGRFGREIEIGYSDGGSSVFDLTPECNLDGVQLGNLVEVEYTEREGFVWRVVDHGPPPPMTRRDYLEWRDG